MSFKPDGDLAAFMRTCPLAYAGFRVLYIYSLRGGDVMAERNEVPFLGNLLFPLLLSVYALGRRLQYLLLHAGRHSGPNLRSADHLFIMTSDHEYKTASFEAVADELVSQGETVAMLCSPAVTSERQGWECQGFETLTFTELLANVSVSQLVAGFIRSVRALRKLRVLYPEGYSVAPTKLTLNVLFLEAVKTAGLRNAVDDPIVHTYAPMPYLLESTTSDHVLTYQHGMLFGVSNEIAMGYPFFQPLTVLMWGEQWRSKVGSFVHPDSDLIPVGSPWHDELAKRGRHEREAHPDCDVLFISGTHGLVSAADHRAYETVVEELVTACETAEWSLAIKLHPNESDEWYRERGWQGHVREFEGILGALNSTRVAVTDVSSALVESALLGTPIVVTDNVEDSEIKEDVVLKNVYFAEPGELEDSITELLAELEADEGKREPPSFADGAATKRIVELATARAN